MPSSRGNRSRGPRRRRWRTSNFSAWIRASASVVQGGERFCAWSEGARAWRILSLLCRRAARQLFMSDDTSSSPVGRRGRIPGPRGLELWKFLLRFGECPHQRLLELVLKHGDIVQLKFPGEMVVVLARPEYIEHILHHRHQN